MRLRPVICVFLLIPFVAAAACPPSAALVRETLARPDLLALELRGEPLRSGDVWFQDMAVQRDLGRGLVNLVLGRLHFVEDHGHCVVLRFERRSERLLNRSFPEPAPSALLAIARSASTLALFGDDAAMTSPPTGLDLADDPAPRWIDAARYSLHLRLSYELRLSRCRRVRLRDVVHEATFRHIDRRWQLVATRRIDTRDPWTDFPDATARDAECVAAANFPQR